MIVYKSIYNTNSKPTIADAHIILPSTSNDNTDVLKTKIYIIPPDEVLYNIIADELNFTKLSMTNVFCSIYFTADNILSKEILAAIEAHILGTYKGELNDQYCKIKYFEKIKTVRDAVNLYKQITIHSSVHSNEIFTYSNYSSDICQIDFYDSRVTYVDIQDRHNTSFLNGKLNDDYEVLLFRMHPISNYKVFVIPDNFTILKATNNKVAFATINNYVYWLVTHYNFINDNSINDAEPLATKFCPQSQSINTISSMLSVFNDFKFNDPQFAETCIMCEDRENSILMFVGIFNLQYGNEYGKYFEKLLIV